MAQVNRMCFRRFFALCLAGLLAPSGATSEPGAGLEGLRVEAVIIALDPGVLEIRVTGWIGGPELEVRSGGARVPLMPDPGGSGRLVARFAEPGLNPGVARRLEVWGLDEADESVLIQPVFIQPRALEGLRAVPDWSKGMVWYQVFPERFRNANPANDPFAWDRTVVAWDQPFRETTLEEVEMLWNRRLVDPQRHSNDPNRWVGGAGGWSAVGNTAFARRYGGDLQGVVERLDHIARLGATGLYLCPVFDARSLHKYEASDHRHVDPTLGDPGEPGLLDRSGEDPLDQTTWAWEPGDRYLVEVLLPAARARELRVILDGVWNHVGRDHFAFRDVVEKGRASAYADWFKAEFDAEGNLSGYDAWDRRNGDLPEFRQTPQGDLAPGPKAHVFAVTRRWMDPDNDGDPSDGIDGWRLDVAPEVGRVFWNEWRGLVRSINPEAVLVGEIWTDAALWFDGVAFDAQMNYPAGMAIADWLAIGQDATDAGRCAERLDAVFNHHPAHDLAQMNLIASHDTERVASLMFNRFDRAFDSGAQPWARGSAYDAGPVDAEAKRRLVAAFVLLAALPGSPMVYNGDEYALPGADDPDNRRPIHWAEIDPTPDQPDERVRAAIEGVLRWRADAEVEAVVRFGLSDCVAVGAEGLVVRRWLGGRMVEVAVARTGEPAFPAVAEGWIVDEEMGGEFPGTGGYRTGAYRVLSWRDAR